MKKEIEKIYQEIADFCKSNSGYQFTQDQEDYIKLCLRKSFMDGERYSFDKTKKIIKGFFKKKEEK